MLRSMRAQIEAEICSASRALDLGLLKVRSRASNVHRKKRNNYLARSRQAGGGDYVLYNVCIQHLLRSDYPLTAEDLGWLTVRSRGSKIISNEEPTVLYIYAYNTFCDRLSTDAEACEPAPGVAASGGSAALAWE